MVWANCAQFARLLGASLFKMILGKLVSFLCRFLGTYGTNICIAMRRLELKRRDHFERHNLSLKNELLIYWFDGLGGIRPQFIYNDFT